MAQDRNGNNHKAAGRPDGGQFDKKAGQGSDDDLDFEAADTRLSKAMPDMNADDRRRLIGAVAGGDPFAENGLESLPEGAKAMVRIMAARGGDQVYRDLAKYNEEMGWTNHGDTSAPAPTKTESAAPSAFVGIAITPDVLEGLVNSGVRDFRGADLSGLDLHGYDLKELNLDGVNLTGANLDHADLSGARLEDAKLDGARFTHVKANGIDLTGASMRKANLSHTTFGDEDYRDECTASLTDVDMEGARLDDTVFYENVYMYDANLKDTTADGIYFIPDSCVGLVLHGAHWTRGHLDLWEEVDFSGGSFRDMDCFSSLGNIRDADLRGSSIPNGRYHGCDMRGASIDNLWELDGCDLRGATIKRLSDCDLRNSRLEGAWYRKDVKGALGVRTDRDPEGKEPFDPAAYGMKER